MRACLYGLRRGTICRIGGGSDVFGCNRWLCAWPLHKGRRRSPAGSALRRKVDAPKFGLWLRELDFDVALRVREVAYLHYAANRILARLQVREHKHLAHVDSTRHPQDAALRKYDDRARFLFEWLGRSAYIATDGARAVNVDWDLKRNSVRTQAG